MIDKEIIIGRLVSFLKKAGDYALLKQHNISDISLKSDYTTVTEVDLYITNFFKETFSDIFSDSSNILIDEETQNTSLESDLDHYKTIWTLDPIDGTGVYARGLPFWGIAIGVFKKQKPWLSITYCPGVREMLICDGTVSKLFTNVFNKTERCVILENQHQPKKLDQKSVIFTASWFGLKFNFQNEITQNLLDIYSCSMALLYVVTGRADAFFFGGRVWDMGGIWAAVENLGLKFINLETGRYVEEIDISRHFDNDWKILKPLVVCFPQNYQMVKTLII